MTRVLVADKLETPGLDLLRALELADGDGDEQQIVDAEHDLEKGQRHEAEPKGRHGQHGDICEHSRVTPAPHSPQPAICVKVG